MGKVGFITALGESGGVAAYGGRWLAITSAEEYVKHFRMWSWRLAESGLEITD